MSSGLLQPPAPINEPIRDYKPGSADTVSVQAVLAAMREDTIEIPLVIGGNKVHSGDVGQSRSPQNHERVLATYHQASASHVGDAVQAATAAHRAWSAMPWQSRAAIFLKAADLVAGPYRDRINAATMLGQGKSIYQAEIDSACELIDFWRFNVHFMAQLYRQQPESARGVWNYVDHRPLEGFVFAVTPFNFTAIAGNLPTAPAMMGNTVLWKPASSAVYSAAVLMDVLEEAGLPPGVINFLPGRGATVGDPALDHRDLAGVHFTGSTQVFQGMWQRIGSNIANYRSYPRIVGETGGKDFVFAHPSADVQHLVTALVRGAFEYQGQKCSAASRAFVPASLWDQTLEVLSATVATISQGDPEDFSNFMGAVIDGNAFKSITDYIAHARSSDDHEILIGGGSDDSRGWFIEPTVVVADSPHARLMVEEIFGPVLTLYRYEDNALNETLRACDEASPYALTGAIMCTDRNEIVRLTDALRYAAGNFYINDKPTGAVVGQQPFGGGRASGTNDKAGSILNLTRWVSPRAVKETFVTPTDYRYPHMAQKDE